MLPRGERPPQPRGTKHSATPATIPGYNPRQSEFCRCFPIRQSSEKKSCRWRFCVKSTMMSSPLLLTGILERAAKIFPNVEIISARGDGSRHRSNYAEVHRRAKQLSAALLQAGIRNGDRVATLMWNQQEHLEAYFGV